MYLGESNIAWCSSTKYVGFTLISSPYFKVDIDAVKRKFFRVVMPGLSAAADTCLMCVTVCVL